MSSDSESNPNNDSALRKIDSQFKKLYGTSSPVTVYRFSSSTQSWNKTDMVGCLFLYERAVQPHYGLCVINKKYATSFLQIFGTDAQFVMDQPFILIRAVEDLRKDPRKKSGGKESVIYSFWFPKSEDCMAAANMLRNMGLKFEGEGETFDKVGEISRCHLDQNLHSTEGNHAGNMLHQILRKGKDAHDVKGK